MDIDIKNIRSKQTKKESKKTHSSMNFDFLKKDISFKRNKINDTKKERFYNQLGILFSSGIDLGTALQIIINDEKSPGLKNTYTQIFDDVIDGMSFSDAMNKSNQFSDYEYFSIKVGEESGRLHSVLKELADYFELRVQQRRQLTGALSYPVMVMLVAVGAVVFMLNVVVPMFAGVFQRFGGELPFITQKVLDLSNWLSANIVACILLLILSIALILYLKRFEGFKKYASLLILRIPFVGKLISKLMHARFCHSVSLLTVAKIPLLDALDMVRKMIDFYPFRTALVNVREFIEKGQAMYEGMEKQSVFDHRLVSLTKVGEEVNQIGPLYSKLYSQYTSEVKHMTSVLGNMLEPLMIVFVGLLVMVILIAMYLPLFQLSTTVM